jgi:hypothetical protein
MACDRSNEELTVMLKKLAVTMIALGLAGCVSSPIVSERTVPATPREIAQIEAAVRYQLIDPSSAMFRSISVRVATLADGTSYRYACGEANGKNRLGGYVGFHVFTGHFEGASFIMDYTDTETASLASDICSWH